MIKLQAPSVRRRDLLLGAPLALLSPLGSTAAAVPPAIDVPALAGFGSHPVGLRALTRDVTVNGLPQRALRCLLWHPAAPTTEARVQYRGALPGETPGTASAYAFDGAARFGAPPDRAAAPFPLVVLSHGYSGAPELCFWLAEALASRGYAVLAGDHADPPITDAAGFGGPLLRRPLDVAQLVRGAQADAGPGRPFSGLIDPERIAVIGYSMGGYGALAAAGAGIRPAVAAFTPGRGLAPFVQGAPLRSVLALADVRAVVAIAPFGGRPPLSAFDPAGLAGLKAPTLFIAGDQDRTVGYDPGVRTLFAGAGNAPRALLTFKEAGHSLGMPGAPPSMTGRLWDLDWFEDPVWRKPRALAVEQHFIAAFLGLHLKGDPALGAYLDLPPDSDQGRWPGSERVSYGALSDMTGGVTVWRGFHNAHFAGLRFERAAAGVTPSP